MYRSVHFDGEKLAVNHAEYLKKHSIVYESPAYMGCDGLPIGNGDMGGMLYHTERAAVLPINKTDVIDFAPDGNFDAWSWQSEEKNTAPVSCGRLVMTDSMPSFDWLYLEEYKETLSLSDGTVTCRCKTPFSSYDYRAYSSKSHGVIVFEVSASSVEAAERKLILEKWGSINLFHDYEQIKPLYDKNLFNVASGAEGRTAYLEQQLNGTHYITAMRVTGCDSRIIQQNSRCVEVVLDKAERHDFTVLLTVATSHTGMADLSDALRILDKAETDFGLLYENQKAAWAEFWSKSLVCLPRDDYLENIYYMNLYQLGSCGTGAYPATFAGLWGWYADTRNWGHYYHWNHQQTYWGVYASGHGELAENYLDYRFNMLENAKTDAKKLFGSKNGAFYSDISNFNGYNALEPDSVRNLTPCAQIALDFYRRYQYAPDEDFLIKKAYPVMFAAAELYLDLLKKEEDGVYRIDGGSTCYESYWNLKETVTDFASVHALFDALLDTAELTGLDKAKAEMYAEIKKNLYPLPTAVTEHNGEPLEVIAAGTKWNGQKTHVAEGDYPTSPFPLCELSAIYPSGYIGLSCRDTKEFETAVNTARLLFDMDVYAKSKIGSCGHSVAIEAAARLGMREDCIRISRLFAERYQQFPSGLTHFADIGDDRFRPKTYRPRVLPAGVKETEWEKLHEKSEGPRTSIPGNYFMHCYFEPAANIMAGINEMLLQSHDGVIRVFPAAEKDFTGMFTLQAAKGFTVTSEAADGEILFVHVRSAFDRVCRLAPPWTDAAIRVESGGKNVEFKLNGGIIEFSAKTGGGYLIIRCEYPLDCYYRESIACKENTAPKEWNGKILGQFSYTKGRSLSGHSF